MAIGILAFGSLIDDPGKEIGGCIETRKNCTTPFSVEFARLSQKRGGAPTLVPVKAGGSQVSAVILVLNGEVTLEQAKTLLWKRETGAEVGEYEEPDDLESNTKKMLARTLSSFEGLETVLYTDFPEKGKLSKPDAETLARAAVESVQSRIAKAGQDGISYLINARKAGIKTPLSESYELEILKLTNTPSLNEALAELINPLTADELEEARLMAYGFAIGRGAGKLPHYRPDEATGDFWRAAGAVKARRPAK